MQIGMTPGFEPITWSCRRKLSTFEARSGTFGCRSSDEALQEKFWGRLRAAESLVAGGWPPKLMRSQGLPGGSEPLRDDPAGLINCKSV